MNSHVYIPSIAAAFVAIGSTACSKSQPVAQHEPQGSGAASSGAASSGAGGGRPQPGCTGDLCSDASNCGALGHFCLGGACQAGVCQAFTLAQHAPVPVQLQGGLFLDASNVYVASGAADCIGGPAVDVTIASYSRATGAETTLLTCGSAAGTTTPPREATFVAGQVFFTSGTTPGNPDGFPNIYRMPRQGGPFTSFGDYLMGYQMVGDDTFLYYVGGVMGAGVYRANFDGSARARIGDINSIATYIAVDDTNVYVVNDPCYYNEGQGSCAPPEPYIATFPKAGGPSRTLIDDAGRWGFTLRDGYIYWLDVPDSEITATIFRAPTSGGPREVVIAQNDITAFAVDSNAVYWVTASFSREYDLSNVPLAGGKKTVLYTAHGSGMAVAIDDQAIVWTSYDGQAPALGATILLLAK